MGTPKLTFTGNHPLFPKHEDGSRDIDTSITHQDTWKNLENLIKSHPDKVKAIGVSNYSVKYMEKLLAKATIVPAVNQIENHPLCPQQEVVDFCKEKGIHITAYSPLGSTGSPLFKDEVVNEVAKKHSVTPAVILLSYHRKFDQTYAFSSTQLTSSKSPATPPSSQSRSLHPASTRTRSSSPSMARTWRSWRRFTKRRASPAAYTRRLVSMLDSRISLRAWISADLDYLRQASCRCCI
jgi:hypothetical protein